MRCVRPVHGFRAIGGGLKFGRAVSSGIPMQVRCGQCIGCRLAKSQEWAVRIMHEAQMHDHSCHVTLTYDNDHLPENGSLDRKAFSAFIKRLRKRLDPVRVRYFQVGEYGENEKRPHHHAVLFGPDVLTDAIPWGTSPSGFPLFRSPLLEREWKCGFAVVGQLSFEMAQYIAKYTTKILNVTKGSSKAMHDAYERRFSRVDPESGEIVQVEPEFATMSRRPGIGESWFRKYGSDVFPSDFVVVDGRKVPTPRYYTYLLEKEDRDAYDLVKRERKANRHIQVNGPSLESLEAVALSNQHRAKERRD